MAFYYNESKFHMWRACIGLIWADGHLSPEEKAWIDDKIKNLHFTDEQKAILENDLKGDLDLDHIFSKITDKKDRAFLSHQMRVIANLDSDFSHHEKELYNSWREKLHSEVDLKKWQAVIAEDEKASYHEDEVYKVYNKHSMFERFDKYLRKLMNPGEYKFPDKK